MPGKPSRFVISIRVIASWLTIEDIYHSYLGLAALATLGDHTLKTLDASLCISSEQRQKIEKLGREALTKRSLD